MLPVMAKPYFHQAGLWEKWVTLMHNKYIKSLKSCSNACACDNVFYEWVPFTHWI